MNVYRVTFPSNLREGNQTATITAVDDNRAWKAARRLTGLTDAAMTVEFIGKESDDYPGKTADR